MAVKFEVLTVNETPPGGWKATLPGTNKVISHYDYTSFIKQYESFCLANKVYLGPLWVEELLSDMCEQNMPLWSNHCKRAGKFKPHKMVSFASVMSFLNVLKKWITDGGVFESQEVAEHRASICSTCPMNSKKQLSWGCGSCSHAYNKLLSWMLGSRTTSYANVCGSCGVCGCAINAAVFFPISAQQEGLTDDMKQTFSELDFCWKRQELGL